MTKPDGKPKKSKGNTVIRQGKSLEIEFDNGRFLTYEIIELGLRKRDDFRRELTAREIYRCV